MTGRLCFLAMLILSAGILNCARPVGVRPTHETKVFQQLTASALSDKQSSIYAKQFMARLGLAERFEEDPAGTLAHLHDGLRGADETDRLFALAELAYLHAKQARDTQYYLAAAVYAYCFLFPGDPASAPNPYDPRLRLAMNLYNRGISNGLRAAKGDGIDLRPRQIKLPFGHLDLRVTPTEVRHFTEFRSVEEYEIYGLRNHYRKPGIGAPLAAWAKPAAGPAAKSWLSPHSRTPLTAFLRFNQPRKALSGGALTGQVELYEANVDASITVEGLSIPLEFDISAVLAYTLNDSPLWDFELAGFRRGDFSVFEKKSDGELYFAQPYRPGRIPVVLVHGTASSPLRWAELFNELWADPRIVSRYQFAYFVYNSGNPIALSAAQLRKKIQTAIAELDPQGKDPALRNMIVVGHSQGGLVTKLTAVNSGTRFWNLISEKPFEEAKLSSETKSLLRETLFIEPLPSVKRVVFIATPHHGCYLVEGLVGRITRRLVTIPGSLTKTSVELFRLNPVKAAQVAFRLPTSIDNMNSKNPFLKALASLPVAPGVKSHSIIAVKGNGPIEKGKDGVVSYECAHHDGVESELVVRSGHSCQSTPQAIEEVRRILYEHAGLR